jgi:hypothetical protein
MYLNCIITACFWIAASLGTLNDPSNPEQVLPLTNTESETKHSRSSTSAVQIDSAPELPSDPRAVDALDAAVLVLNWQLKNADPDEVCFVATGRSADGWIDPTPAVMKRLAESRRTLLPASAARLPKAGEMLSEHRYRGVEDPDTGKQCYVYNASVTKWIDDNTAEVKWCKFGGPLSGGGGIFIVEKKNGKWRTKKDKDWWVY